MESHRTANPEHWRSSIIPESRFGQRREPHLEYSAYANCFEKTLNSFGIITTEVIPEVADIGLERASLITRVRLDEVLNWISLQYSAGAPVELFAEVWPQTLAWAEEFAAYNSEVGTLTHVLLSSEEYWLKALRLVCFALLSGHADQMPRVMAIVDYGNPRDGLLERLAAPFVPGRGTPTDTSTRHLPYRKLFPLFQAAPGQRPALMSRYLEEWYSASRREIYFDQHEIGPAFFYGYWSWEAAAVTWLLDIDDASYRDLPYYPRDLVDFSRQLSKPSEMSPIGSGAPTRPPDSATGAGNTFAPDLTPGSEMPWNIRTALDSKGRPLDLDEREARVRYLLRLINADDERAVRWQFDVWRKVFAEDLEEIPEEDFPDQWVDSLSLVINGYSGYRVDWKDTESFMATVDTLARRWNLSIDWLRDLGEDEFLDARVYNLTPVAHQQLREQGCSLWQWNTGEDSYAGWITRSHDDEVMQTLGWLLGVEMQTGNVSF